MNKWTEDVDARMIYVCGHCRDVIPHDDGRKRVCEAGVGASSLVTAQLLAKLSVMTKNKHARVTFMYDKFNMRDPKRINTPKNRCTPTTNQK